jgi:hypothetical protein
MCGTNELLKKCSSAQDLSSTGQKGVVPVAEEDERKQASAFDRLFGSNRAAFDRQRAEREAVLDAMRMLS